MTISRYIWLMLLAILLPVALGLLWLLYSGWQAQESHVRQQLDGLAQQQQQLLDYQLDTGQHIAANIASAEWTRQLDPRHCTTSLLSQALASADDFSNIVTFDLAGNIICSALPLDQRGRMRIHALPILPSLLLQDKPAISEPFFAPLSQRWVSVLSHPIHNKNGQRIGQVIMPLDLDTLQRVAIPPELPANTYWQVTSANQKLIQSSNSNQIPGSHLPPPRSDEQHFQQQRLLQHANWLITATVPSGSVYSALLQQGSPLIVGMLLAIVLAGVGGWLFARELLHTVNHLTRFILRVGRGENSLRAKPRGPQELVLLGQEINRMLDAVEFSESRYRLLFGSATDGVVVVDEAMQILAINEQGASMFGYSVDELTGQSANLLLPLELRDAHQHVARGYAEKPVARAMGHRPTLKGQRKDGSTVLVQITLSPLPHGSSGIAAAIIRDVSEQHLLQEKLQWLSQYDALTNLPNRLLLNDRLNQAIRHVHGSQQPLALVLIGLDHFKAINDNYGHDCGDRVLSIYAHRLAESMGEDCTVARVGGDEFAVLIEDKAAAHQLPGVLERLRQTLRDPIDGATHEKLLLGASLGVALFPGDAQDGGGLLKIADLALMQAKQNNRGSICFFSEEHMPRYRSELELEIQLRAAIASDSLVPFFQPIVDVASGRISGVEALVRWPHAQGMMSPATFLPLAEAAGLLPSLERQVRSKALAAVRQWHEQGFAVWLTINVSPGEFDSPHFAADLAILVQQAGLHPAQIILEITEGAVINDQHSAVARMLQLQSMGYRIAIDDFGTGYSSLSYLHTFPFDRLKLDRSFVARLQSDDKARKVTAAIIAMAHELGLLVIAEGIEEAGQLAMLRTMGCDYVQGFYLYHPMPYTQMNQLLQHTHPATAHS